MNKNNIKGMSDVETHNLLAGLIPAAKALIETHMEVRIEIARMLVQQYPISLTAAIQCYSDAPTAANKDTDDGMKTAYASLNLLGNYLRKQKAERDAAAATAALVGATPSVATDAKHRRRKSKKIVALPLPQERPGWMKDAGVKL